MTYKIYGRKEYEKPLSFVAEILLTEAQDLDQAAFKAAGEQGWVELVAIPEDDLIPVIKS